MWLQVGYLYDWLLIDRLILHNRRKGYLSVCARVAENGLDRRVCVSSTMDERLSFTHNISVDLTPPCEVMALMSYGLILESFAH